MSLSLYQRARAKEEKVFLSFTNSVSSFLFYFFEDLVYSIITDLPRYLSHLLLSISDADAFLTPCDLEVEPVQSEIQVDLGPMTG